VQTQAKEKHLAIKTRKKGNTGKRYTDDQKRQILEFVRNQGRGGITAAGKKFGVSYIALRRWMNGTGTGSGRKAGRPPKSKALDGRKLRSVQSALAAVKGMKKQLTVLAKTLKQLGK
jgi:transposase-like protein